MRMSPELPVWQLGEKLTCRVEGVPVQPAPASLEYSFNVAVPEQLCVPEHAHWHS